MRIDNSQRDLNTVVKRSQQKNKVGSEDYESLLERLMSVANLLKLRYSLVVSFSPINLIPSNISVLPALERVTHISHVWDCMSLISFVPLCKDLSFPSHLVAVQRDGFPSYTLVAIQIFALAPSWSRLWRGSMLQDKKEWHVFHSSYPLPSPAGWISVPHALDTSQLRKHWSVV